MNIHEKMHNGDLYLSGDTDLVAEQLTFLENMYDFNATRPSEMERRNELLKKMFAEIGEDCYVEPPLHSNWGGKHVHFGKGVYANFNLTLVDDTHIYVGDYTMFGPNVVMLCLQLRDIRFCPNCDPLHISTTCLYISVKTVGLVQV